MKPLECMNGNWKRIKRTQLYRKRDNFTAFQYKPVDVEECVRWKGVENIIHWNIVVSSRRVAFQSVHRVLDLTSWSGNNIMITPRPTLSKGIFSRYYNSTR